MIYNNEDRRQKTEDRRQKTEVGSRKKEIRPPTSDFQFTTKETLYAFPD